MKTLEELVKELGLKPTCTERNFGRCGNYLIVYLNNEYTTYNKYEYARFMADLCYGKVIEVKPE